MIPHDDWTSILLDHFYSGGKYDAVDSTVRAIQADAASAPSVPDNYYVDAIKKYLDGDYSSTKKNEKCAHGFYGFECCETCIDEYFIGVLAAAPKQPDGWRPNSELPESGWVLGYNEDNKYPWDVYSVEVVREFGASFTKWQPLPPPPKKED